MFKNSLITHCVLWAALRLRVLHVLKFPAQDHALLDCVVVSGVICFSERGESERKRERCVVGSMDWRGRGVEREKEEGEIGRKRREREREVGRQRGSEGEVGRERKRRAVGGRDVVEEREWGWGHGGLDYISVSVSFDSRLCWSDRNDHVTVWRERDGEMERSMSQKIKRRKRLCQ